MAFPDFKNRLTRRGEEAKALSDRHPRLGRGSGGSGPDARLRGHDGGDEFAHSRLRGKVFVFVLSLLLSVFFLHSAHADCASPAGVAGAMVYSDSDDRMYQCDGTDWTLLGKPGTPHGGAGCTAPVAARGTVIFNKDCHVMQYCDGNNWAALGPVICNRPDVFGFTDLTDVALSTQTDSNILQITGISGSAATSISGGGGQYRICADATCSTNPAFISTASTITVGKYIQLRMTSAATDLTAKSTTMTVGVTTDTWSITTGDTTPAVFTFTDLIDQPQSTVTDSNIVQITGISIAAATSIASSNGTGKYRICNDATCSAAPSFGSGASTITSGQYIQLRVTSSATGSTAVTATMTVGFGSDVWSVTTIDNTPNAFSFTDLTAQAKSTLLNSNILQITGITGNIPTSIANGSGKYRICADATCSTAPAFITSASTITNNQYLQLQITSSAVDLTAVTTDMTVGTVSDNWSVTTNDNAPTAFSFTDQTGIAVSTVRTSNIIQITGITGNVATSISGSSAAYRVCADATCSTAPAFITSASTITNNQYLQLQMTSSGSYDTAVGTTMTVGAGSDNWSVTTQNDDVPDALIFTDQSGVPTSTVRTSNILQITGISGSVATSIANGGGKYRVCADATCSTAPAFISTPSTIMNSQYLQLQITSSGTLGLTVSTDITVGTLSDNWSVATANHVIITWTGTTSGNQDMNNTPTLPWTTSGTYTITINTNATLTFKGAAGGGSGANGSVGDSSVAARLPGAGGAGGGGGAVTTGTDVTLVPGKTYTLIVGAAGGLTRLTNTTDAVVLVNLNPGSSSVGGTMTVGTNGVTGGSGGGGGPTAFGPSSWPGGNGTSNAGGTGGGGGGGGGGASPGGNGGNSGGAGGPGASWGSHASATGGYAGQGVNEFIGWCGCDMNSGGGGGGGGGVSFAGVTGAYGGGGGGGGGGDVNVTYDVTGGGPGSGNIGGKGVGVVYLTSQNTPDTFSFTDQTGVALSTQTDSNYVQITGIYGNVATSISGGSAQYRICTGAGTGCGGFTTGASTIQDGQYLQLRLTSSGSYVTAVNTTMTVGTGSDNWSVSTTDGAFTGMIMFFTGSCPAGWSEYTALRGRYALAAPAGGTLAATVGTALSNMENRAVGQHTHTQDAHTHTQNAHSHTQNAHSHTQDAHTHTQNAHTHTQSAHSHTINKPIDGSDVNMLVADSGTGNDVPAWSGGTHTQRAVQNATAANNNATATNQDATATNQNTTATNQATTATNQSTTATNQNAGSVAGTNAPYIQLTACQSP